MRYIFLAAVVVFFAALAAPVMADTVYLKNGRKMVGRVSLEGDQVVVETGMGIFSFSRRQIERIERDDKTLKVPRKSGIPRKGTAQRLWEVVPDMPYHHVDFAAIEAGAKLVAYNPRSGVAIYGTVKEALTGGEKPVVRFEAPSRARFTGEHAEVFSFYKVDTDLTLAKMLFFCCRRGDRITLSIAGVKKREVVFREVSGGSVVVREGTKAPETLAVKTIYKVKNPDARMRALESYLKSKGLGEGESFSFTESDGTVRTGKLVRGAKGLEVESEVEGLKLDWALADRIVRLSPEEHEARTKRLKSSKATYSPAVKPGDNVRAAVAGYGKPEMEGDGITGKVGIEGAESFGLYTRYFSGAGLWVSSRKNIIYEIEAEQGFTGKIYGLSVGAPVKEAMKETDIHFYRRSINNPRVLVSDTLSPIRVEILLDAKMEIIEKIKVSDPALARDWEVKAGVVMRRFPGSPGK